MCTIIAESFSKKFIQKKFMTRKVLSHFFSYISHHTHTHTHTHTHKHTGYEGPNCEIDIDECAAGPCQNEGECFQRSDPAHWEAGRELDHAHAAGYICQCHPGFAGQPTSRRAHRSVSTGLASGTHMCQ